MDFDKAHWSEVIRRADWPTEFHKFAKKAKLKTKADEAAQKKLNKKVRRFFEHALTNHEIYLGQSGPDFDKQRLPIDTIVIHHTSAKPRYKLPYLNAVQLLNIYVPVFATDFKGQPVWSGHFYKDEPVFWGYHWLMRMDGTFKRLLEDNQIGWHAGNWNINRRSIGICLDNDYENHDPRGALLKQLAAFIGRTYSDIKPQNIIGHCEAHSPTACPGSHFIGGWKPTLLNYLYDS